VTDADEALAAEAELVARSRRGDSAAFEELVRIHGRTLFARLYLETGDAHRAEDLAQEAMLSAWRSIGQLQDPRRFRPWLLSVARSVLLDAARRESRKKRETSRGREQGEAMLRLTDDHPDPSESAAAHDERQQALAALRSLPEEYRIPLTLRYLAGADYQAIGRELALTNGSLRGLLSRGMAMLRERMGRKM